MRARRDLVEQDGTIRHQEELDAEDAATRERRDGGGRYLRRQSERRLVDARRNEHRVQLRVDRCHLNHRIAHRHATRRARHHHRELLGEEAPPLRVQLFLPIVGERRECARRLDRRANRQVAAPVVRILFRLQHDRVAPALARAQQRGHVGNLAKVAERHRAAQL